MHEESQAPLPSPHTEIAKRRRLVPQFPYQKKVNLFGFSFFRRTNPPKKVKGQPLEDKFWEGKQSPMEGFSGDFPGDFLGICFFFWRCSGDFLGFTVVFGCF